MKSVLLKIIILVAVVAGGVFLAYKQGVQLPFAAELPEVPQNITDQTKVLGERSQEVSGHVQNVLGAFVQENTDENKSKEEKKPIHEQAFEYGRYEYCKQVIKDYETAHPQN